MKSYLKYTWPGDENYGGIEDFVITPDNKYMIIMHGRSLVPILRNQLIWTISKFDINSKSHLSSLELATGFHLGTITFTPADCLVVKYFWPLRGCVATLTYGTRTARVFRIKKKLQTHPQKPSRNSGHPFIVVI